MEDLINSALYFSYYPNCHRSDIPEVILNAFSEDMSTNADNNLQKCVAALKDAVDQEYHHDDIGKVHIVPLSSGLDSRAILAVLLDHPEINKSDLHTVTFGTPGTWDFQIAQDVSEAAGVSNTAIDLTDESFDWSLESLQEYASQRNVPGRMLDGYVNSLVSSTVDDECVIWSGFIGDPTTGSHLPVSPRADWGDACDYFVNHEQYCGGLSHPDFDPISVLPNSPLIPRQQLSYEEQLDFALRQQCLISPIVIQSDHYKIPFMRPSWLRFSLNLPSDLRQERALFKNSFLSAYPKLFTLPTDANSGLPISAGKLRSWIRGKQIGATAAMARKWGLEYTHPGTNYLNFAKQFRIDGELKDTIHQCLLEFSERDVASWIDPEEIWEAHQAGEDWSSEIRVIASLELYLSES